MFTCRHHLHPYEPASLALIGRGVFGPFDLAALCGCHTLNVCYVVLRGLAVACVFIGPLTIDDEHGYMSRP